MSSSSSISLFDRNTDRHVFAMAVAVAGVSLGHAVQLANGAYEPDAILWLAGAIVAATVGVLVPAWAPLETVARHMETPLLLTALAWQFQQLLTKAPAIYLRATVPEGIDLFHAGAACGLVAAAVAVAGSRRARAIAVPVMIACYVAMGYWLIKHSPDPFIDVYVMHREASKLLVRGENPYAMTIPNIYGSSAFYGPVIAQGDRVQLGYMYPPVSLLLSIPGHVLGGDYRYSILAAIAAGGGFIAYCRPGPRASAAAALLLFTPRTLFVLEQGWTDSFVLALLAMSVFAAFRARWLLPFALGALLSSKQYGIVFLPVVLLLRPLYPSWRALFGAAAKGLVFAVVLALPFVVWNPRAMLYNTVLVQSVLPFRPDSMNFFAWWNLHKGAQLPSYLGFAAAAVANALCLARAPRTPSGFAGSVVFVLLVFVAFNRQAFCNYYYFILGGMFVALAAAGTGRAGAAQGGSATA